MKSVIYCVYLLILFILIGCASTQNSEIVYIRADTGRHLHVYNTKTMSFSVESVDYLKGEKSYSDFGGSFSYCGSTEFLCIVGGIGAAVPKLKNGQTNWQFENWICQSKLPLESNQDNKIECSYKNQITKFLYASHRGIVEYSLTSNDGKEERYILLGEFGLISGAQN